MHRPHLSNLVEEFDTAGVTLCAGLSVLAPLQRSVTVSVRMSGPSPVARALTSYLLGEFDALGVCQRFGLFINILYIQHLAHELDHRLSTVEGCC